MNSIVAIAAQDTAASDSVDSAVISRVKNLGAVGVSCDLGNYGNMKFLMISNVISDHSSSFCFYKHHTLSSTKLLVIGNIPSQYISS